MGGGRIGRVPCRPGVCWEMQTPHDSWVQDRGLELESGISVLGKNQIKKSLSQVELYENVFLCVNMIGYQQFYKLYKLSLPLTTPLAIAVNVQVYGCESWTIKKAENDALEMWC